MAVTRLHLPLTGCSLPTRASFEHCGKVLLAQVRIMKN